MVWTGWHLAKLLLIFLQVTLVLLTGPLVFDFIQLKKHICLLNIPFWLTRKRNACGLESGSWSIQFQWWQASSWFEYNVWQLLNLLLEIRICIVQHSMKITLFIVKHNSNGNFFSSSWIQIPLLPFLYQCLQLHEYILVRSNDKKCSSMNVRSCRWTYCMFDLKGGHDAK